MRIAPVAVRFASDPHRLRAEAERSARVTHVHAVGVDGAVVQAAAIGAALRGQDTLAAARAVARTQEMQEALGDVGELLGGSREPAEVAARIGSWPDARYSVPAALYAALAHAQFEETVVFAVRLGGDTDTVAAMAGAIAGARTGASSIPDRWLDALEDGERGRSYVQTLADRL
jgi:poly(ADP-ribose) glycohydrolase ARH3